MTTISQAINELASALDYPIDGARADAIRVRLERDELAGTDSAPTWLIDFILSLARRTHTPSWVPFEVKGLEASGAFDFVRGMGEILPVTVGDYEERWVVSAPALAHEAHLSFEGYLWLSKPIGAPEPGEE